MAESKQDAGKPSYTKTERIYGEPKDGEEEMYNFRNKISLLAVPYVSVLLNQVKLSNNCTACMSFTPIAYQSGWTVRVLVLRVQTSHTKDRVCSEKLSLLL